jgi:hypothetical protein
VVYFELRLAPDHRDVTADALESGALVGEETLDLRPALQLHTEFHEERDGGIHVLDDDADVVHPLNRHAGLSFLLVRPVVAADVPGTEPVARSRHPQTAELRKNFRHRDTFSERQLPPHFTHPLRPGLPRGPVA